MAAMLEAPNNERYLHKNKVYFPKENHSIVSLLQYGRCEHYLIYTSHSFAILLKNVVSPFNLILNHANPPGSSRMSCLRRFLAVYSEGSPGSSGCFREVAPRTVCIVL